MRLPILFLLGVLSVSICAAQPTTSPCTQLGSLTTATPFTAYTNNTSNPTCNSWSLTWSTTGFSAITLKLEGSDDGSSWTTFTGVVLVNNSVNPSSALSGVITVQPITKNAFLRVNATSVTGSGAINFQLRGSSGIVSKVGTGAGGSCGALGGDLSGTCAAAMVVGIENHALTGVQGNGALAQLSTGSPITNDIVKFDANGNTVNSSILTANVVVNTSPGTTTAGDCLQVQTSLTNFITDSGNPCGLIQSIFGNSGPVINNLVVPSLNSLTFSGTGTINANLFNGAVFPVSAPVMATNASRQGIAGTTSGTGSTVLLQGSPSITTPTIGDFTNSQHNHQNAAGGGQLTEAALNLSNNTTNNVSISAHGFAPILPNDSTKFFNGAGSYSVPAGGGGTGGGVVTYSGPALSTLSGTIFCPVGGGASCSGTETNVDIDSSAAATVTNLYVQLSQALGVGNSVVITWRKNASSQTSTCTISGASATSCNDTTHSFNVATGDLLDYQLAFSGTIIVTPTITMMSAFGTSNIGVTNVTGSSPISSSGGNTPAISCTSCLTGTPTNHGVAIGTATQATNFTGAGNTGQVLTSNGPSADPTYQALPASGSSVTFGGYGSLSGTCAHSSSASDLYYTTDSYYQFVCTATNTFSPFMDGKQVVLPAAANTWTVVNGNSGTATLANSAGAVVLSTATEVLGLETALKTIPSAPYTKIIAYRAINGLGSTASGSGSDIARCGVALTSGTATSSSIQIIGLGTFWQTSGGVQYNIIVNHYTNYTYSGSGTDAYVPQPIGVWGGTIWVKIVDDNTNRTLSISNDGVNFLTLKPATARTTPFTPTNYGIFCGAQNAISGTSVGFVNTLLSDN